MILFFVVGGSGSYWFWGLLSFFFFFWGGGGGGGCTGSKKNKNQFMVRFLCDTNPNVGSQWKPNGCDSKGWEGYTKLLRSWWGLSSMLPLDLRMGGCHSRSSLVVPGPPGILLAQLMQALDSEKCRYSIVNCSYHPSLNTHHPKRGVASFVFPKKVGG